MSRLRKGLGVRHRFAQDLAQDQIVLLDGSVITMTQVAREAGVSLSTVSHVLNQTRQVSESTRLKVLTAAAASAAVRLTLRGRALPGQSCSNGAARRHQPIRNVKIARSSAISAGIATDSHPS